MELIALGIIAVSVFAAFSKKIHTDFLLLHLLFLAATCAACSLIPNEWVPYSPLTLMYALIFSIISATYWMWRKIKCVLKQHKQEI